MKRVALLMAIIMMLSPIAFAMSPIKIETVAENAVDEEFQETSDLYAERPAGLYYYQDFENIEPGHYTEAQVKNWLSLIDSPSPETLSVSLGAIGGANAFVGYEIAQEADGNRYLIIRGSNYPAFGAIFSDGMPHYANISFKYKTDNASADYAIKKAEGTDSIYHGDNEKYPNVGTWSSFAGRTKSSTASGLGLVCLTGSVVQVHIDDIKVWCSGTDAEASTGNISTGVVTFDIGETAESAGITVTPFKYNWDENTGVVNIPGVTSEATGDRSYLNKDFVNLSECVVSGDPVGYGFAGWSMTEGGKKIKADEYENFKILGDMTLYAVWEPRETVTITFANSTSDAPETYTLPQALSANKWETDKDNIDLSTYTASTTKAYDFLGWSATDGGAIISESELETYQPSADVILYAIWKNDSTPAGLYFYQDFESFATGYYDADTISKWLSSVESPKEGLTVSLNSISGMGSFVGRIMKDDETGNKYLRIQSLSGDAYLSFGAHFSDESLRGFNMAFNYKYTNSMNANFTKAHDIGNTYKATLSGVENNGYPLTWTYKAWSTDEASNGLGLGVNHTSLYLDIDDIRVWCVKESDTLMPSKVSSYHNLTAKITFSPGSFAANAAVTMPSFVHVSGWGENVGIVNVPGVTEAREDYHRHDYVNLEKCIPVGAPYGYEFAGWSATDGGTKIKDTEYTNYKITGNQTLYALWKEIVLPDEVIKYTPNNSKAGVADGTVTVAAVKDAERYTKAQLFYADDNNDILSDYTKIAELNVSSGVATYTFEGGKAFPKNAAKIAVKFTADDKDEYITYCDIPEANRFNIDETPLFTFYAISDLHIQPGYYTENRNAVADDILNNNPDFVVINGDLVNQGTTGSYKLLDDFLNEKFNAHNIPAFVTNGNHEFAVDAGSGNVVDKEALLGSFSKQMAVLKGMGYDIDRTDSDLWYSTIIDGAKFIFMSTPESEASRIVSEKQLAFLDKELEEGKKSGLPMYVFTHMPLTGCTPGATTTVENTDEVKDILNKYSGVTVVSGHTHSNLSYDDKYVRLPEGGDTFTHINDGCAAFLKKSDGKLETSFTAGQVIEVYEDKVIFKARKFDAANGSKYFGHGQYVWYFGDLEKTANITRFENSTKDAPKNVVLPQAVVTDEGGAVNISVLAATAEGVYKFKGWSESDNGTIITEYVPNADGILYAIWEDMSAVSGITNSSIRLANANKSFGIRNLAVITEAQKGNATEYGFIASLPALIGADYTKLTFEDMAAGRYVTGASYIKDAKNPLIYAWDGQDIVISGVLTGIDEAHYDTTFVVRAYVKIGGTTYYGAPKEITARQAAQTITATTPGEQEQLNAIINYVAEV